MDELIDIVNENGEPTNKVALKSEAHKSGWWHNTIHLWLFTNEGRVLLQQRSYQKAIYPLLWDVSVAGHINAGESFKTAALREAEEELGLELKYNNLKKIGVYKHKSSYLNNSVKDYEFHHIYISELKVELKSLIPNKEEVEAIKLVTLESFNALLKNSENNNHFVSSNRAYYEFVLAHIKNFTK